MGEKNNLDEAKIETLREIKTQFEIIADLLALLVRKTLNPKEIKENITKGRKDKEQYINIFNSCDGETSLTEIARKHKIGKGNFSRDIDAWVKQGFLIKINKEGKVFPKALAHLK